MLNRVSRKGRFSSNLYSTPQSGSNRCLCHKIRAPQNYTTMVDRCNIFQKSAYIYKYFIKVVFNNIDCTFKRTEMWLLGLNLATTIFLLKLIR